MNECQLSSGEERGSGDPVTTSYAMASSANRCSDEGVVSPSACQGVNRSRFRSTHAHKRPARPVVSASSGRSTVIDEGTISEVLPGQRLLLLAGDLVGHDGVVDIPVSDEGRN